MHSRPPVFALAVVAALALAGPVQAQDRRGPGPVEAQAPAAAPQATVLQDASDTRNQFRELLQLHAPALGRVLKLDPQLMTSEAYLAPYPAVAQFLKAHPEVARNPGYFLGFIDTWGNIENPLSAEGQARRDAINVWNNTLESITVVGAMTVVAITLIWLVRTVIGHRRWLRTAKTQSEVHGRLLERFSSNDELMAYVQSPAGRQFLTAMPMLDMPSAASPIAAPFGRILWAVQAGLVLASGGIGMLVVRDNVIPEIADALLTMGVMAIALGAGFALSSLASYLISRRLGLIEPKATPPSVP